MGNRQPKVVIPAEKPTEKPRVPRPKPVDMTKMMRRINKRKKFLRKLYKTAKYNDTCPGGSERNVSPEAKERYVKLVVSAAKKYISSGNAIRTFMEAQRKSRLIDKFKYVPKLRTAQLLFRETKEEQFLSRVMFGGFTPYLSNDDYIIDYNCRWRGIKTRIKVSIANLNLPALEIANVVTEHDYRGRGLFTLFLTKLEEYCNAQKPPIAIMVTHFSNDALFQYLVDKRGYLPYLGSNKVLSTHLWAGYKWAYSIGVKDSYCKVVDPDHAVHPSALFIPSKYKQKAISWWKANNGIYTRDWPPSSFNSTYDVSASTRASWTAT